jgi:uncharacterized damage-inducible protein DinB
MKELLKQYAAFNIWSTQKLAEVILALPEKQQLAELPSSFSSLQKTLLHMWDAESIWWQRLKLQERISRPSDHFKGNTKDAVNGLINQSKQWEEWVNNATDLSIEHVFQYQTFDGTQYKQPTWQMLLHIFNHSTYHRGQLVNMLRQSGVEKIPGTDFILWSRKK